MLYCGVSRRSVTPDHPVYLAGYAARWGTPSIGVHDDIACRAFYFECGGERMLLLFVDAEGLPKQSEAPVRTRIRKELGITSLNIACTHTHSAPHTYAQAQLEKDELDECWLAFLREQMFQSARDAMNNTFRATLGYGHADVPEIARNRRAGHFEVDPALFAVAIRDENGCVRGAIVSYGCHGTVLDASNLLISADYPGYLCRMLEREYPKAVAAFANAAAGDVNIGYSSDASALGERMDIRTFENAERIGGILFSYAKTLIDGAETEDAPIGMRAVELRVPLLPELPPLNQVWEDVHALNKKIAQETSPDLLRALWLQKIYKQCVILRMAHNRPENGVLHARCNLISLGELLVATIPGELFAGTGLELRHACGAFDATAIWCYSNGYIGYIPSRDAMEEGGYESYTSLFAADVAEEIARQIRESAAFAGAMAAMHR